MGRLMKWRYSFFVCCLLFVTVIGTPEAGEKFTIAQVHYSGGGDWYGDATAIKNWLHLLRTRTDIETDEERVILKLTDHILYQYPMLYLVGHGNIRLTESEVEI